VKNHNARDATCLPSPRLASSSPRHSTASVGPADNAGPIFGLRLSLSQSAPRACAAPSLSPSSLRAPRFLISFPTPAAEQRHNDGLARVFGCPGEPWVCRGPLLGPRQRHGNWSDVGGGRRGREAETGYGGRAGADGMSGEEEARDTREGRRGKDPRE